MSKPAQPPPETLSPVEQLGNATAELMLLLLSALVGLANLFVLMWLGVLPDAEAAPWSAIVAGPILMGSAALTYLMLEHAFAREGNPPQPLETRDGRKRASFLVGVLIALGAVVVATIGSTVLALTQQLVFAVEVEEQQTIVELVDRGQSMELLLLAVSAVILAPVTEELFFRHMFFRRLLQRAGPVAAWTLPALAFALAHWNPVGLIVYVWLGSVFAMAYLLSGRLWVAMLAHAGHNAIALTLLLYAPDVLP